MRHSKTSGQTATLGALNALVLVGLSFGLIVSAIIFSNQIASLQAQVNDMNVGSAAIPCYSFTNQPSVPSQMKCIGNGNDSPTPNCDLAYTTIDGANIGPSLCGGLFLTRINGKTAVLLGFGGELYYENAVNNDNGSYKPEFPSFNNTIPFTNVIVAYRFDNYIPAAYRPSSISASVGVVEANNPSVMLATTIAFGVWPNGTLDIYIPFGDTAPSGGGGRHAWTIGSQLGLWYI